MSARDHADSSDPAKEAWQILTP